MWREDGGGGGEYTCLLLATCLPRAATYKYSKSLATEASQADGEVTRT